MSEKITYIDAFEELKRIVAELDRGEISMDDLSEKVKKAAQLITLCKAKLHSTEEDVSKILGELEAAASTGAEG
jgi:exodeoxyribonuclease VII small subunit